MRVLPLSKSGINKIKSHSTELKSNDIEDSIRSIPPGEWCVFSANEEHLMGFINPLIEDKYTCAYVLAKISHVDTKELTPEFFIRDKIKRAWDKRNSFKSYALGARIFYGMSDGLPGLIIDHYENASIIQINTAGIDRYRELIKKTVEEITGVTSYFLDNTKYREKEFLPTYETVSYPELIVIENGLKFKIRPEVLQKVGFYYDHRENRFNLMRILDRLDVKAQRGLDLFSYAGAWGMSALSAGVQNVDFVDQGDFEIEVNESLKLNGLADRGKFIRKDVFRFLDEMINQNIKYDVILCDPPAFAKSSLQRDQALEGYSKLHRKVLKCTAKNSVCAFSSCTHYVSHDDFQKNILDAAKKEGKKLQLIHVGMQGWDHPIQSLADKSNYIKSYFYIVE